MKKILVFLCTAVLLAAFLGSCGRTQTRENRFVDGKMVISVMNWEASSSIGAVPCEIYQYIQDRFGIVLEVFDVGWDNYEDLANLWAQADALPDIIGGADFVYTAIFRDWIENRIIRPLPKDLSEYPALNYLLNQPAIRDLQVNGENYFFPRIFSHHAEYAVLARGIINRKDWRERLGLPIPRTEEDFLNMWRAFSDPGNNMNGNNSIVFGLLPYNTSSLDEQTFAGHGDTRTFRWVQQSDGTVVLPGLESSALPLLSFLRDANREGLIDPDFITNPGGDITWKTFAQGRAGTLLRHISPTHLDILYNFWGMLNPNVDFFDAIELLLPPIKENVTPLFLGGTGFWSETYVNAHVDDEKMEKILSLFDWLLSEEGINKMVFGFEGKDWIKQDGEIVMLTPKDETGRHLIASDLYLFASGGLSYLGVWPLEIVEWINPNISKPIRDMAVVMREKMLGPGMGLTESDNRITAIATTLPEVGRMAFSGREEWAAFITDRSNLSNQELFNRYTARWAAAGYNTAREAMTRAVAAQAENRE
jgi:putative aldouronate transport system substrate-binding protein